MLDALAHHEAAPVEVDALELARRVGQEELAEGGLGVACLLADHVVVDGHVAPAEHLQPLGDCDLLDRP